MSLVALVVVGDGKGNVGLGMGRPLKCPWQSRRASRTPRRTCSRFPSPPRAACPTRHRGQFGAGRVLIKPAIEGTGVIAGGPVRAALGARWHHQRSLQVPGHRQRHEHHQGHCRGPEGALQPRADRRAPWHHRLRDVRGRRTNDGRIQEDSPSPSSAAP
jgi:hypothetical protein